MSLHVGNKDITLVYIGTLAITEIYEGANLAWQAIRSCFGRGFWINNKPWSNKDGWKNKV